MSPKAQHKVHIIKEAFIASVVTIVFTWLISFFPLKYEFLKAIRQDVYGFDIYDLYYTGKDANNLIRDESIVLIQIADDRRSIADQIDLIEKYQPKVIGIDAFFEKPRDSSEDSKLVTTLKKHSNLVFSSLIDTINHKPSTFFSTLKDENNSLIIKQNFFDGRLSNYKSGYINFVGNQFSVIRNYPPFININGENTFSFTSRIALFFSPTKFEKLRSRNNEQEIINYTGNLEKYTSITKEELTEFNLNNQLPELLKNKIVLLGYFIKHPPFVLSDLHFSPVNKEFAGKSFPDMYGVVIHANILSMILKGSYAKSAAQWISYLFSFLIIFFFLLYIINLHSKISHPRHAKILLIQFLLIIVVLYVFLEIYTLFLWKVPLLPIMISLVLCVELFGIYQIIASFLNRKTNYKTVFIHKK